MSIKKTLKALSSLWVGSLMAAFLAFITQVIVVRILGPNEYGVLSSALSAATLIAPLAGFGIPQLWLKIFGTEGYTGARWIPASFKFIKYSATATIALLIAWGLIAPHSKETQIILFALTFHIAHLLFTEITSSKLQLEERYKLLSIIQIVPHALRLLVISTIYILHPTSINALTIALVYAGVAIPSAIFGSIEMSRLKRGVFNLKGHSRKDNIKTLSIPTPRRVFFDSLPFGMAATFHLVMFQINVILINYLDGPKEAGIYNVAFTIMTAVYIIPGVIFQKFLLPKIHRWAIHDRAKFVDMYKKGNLAMLLLGSTAMISVALLAPWIIPMLFGDKFIAAVPILQILSICAPVRFLASSVGTALVTQEHMKLKVYLMGTAAAFNIISSTILIQKMNLTGAAISTVLSDILLLSLYYFFAQKKVFSKKHTIQKTEEQH